MSTLLFIIILLIVVVLYILMKGALKRHRQKEDIADMIEIKRNFDKIDALKKGDN